MLICCARLTNHMSSLAEVLIVTHTDASLAKPLSLPIVILSSIQPHPSCLVCAIIMRA